MGIENLLAQGTRARPAGMEQNALMQGQEMQQRQMQNALMQYQMQSAMRKDAADKQAAAQLMQWRNALQVPQGEQYVQPGRPAMNAAQAESAVGSPGYGMSSAQDQVRTMPADPRMVQAVQLAKAGQMSPMDLFKIQNPERKLMGVKADETVIDERTGQQVFSGSPKAEKPPSAVQEYQFAVGQGYKGTFEQWDTTRKRAGATNVSVGEKPPAGYKWNASGGLDAIPGGPADKLPEKQQNTVIGAQNVRAAISEYRAALDSFSKLDTLKPDERAKMGTKYNNMMLQAKEAYNLGVLNGPDLEILTSVITDPRSLTGAMTSKRALDTQASELDRIMQGIADVASQPRPRGAEGKPAQSAPKPGAVLKFDANGNPVK